jgi:hypothetical protein
MHDPPACILALDASDADTPDGVARGVESWAEPARAMALGDTILADQSRWYLVYYRDPIVLGGCPATDTFNATATGRVDWSL